MTKLLGRFLLAAIALVAFSSAHAQVRHEIAIDRAQIQSDRQAIVAANLPLTEEQAKALWPVYREYRVEMQKLGDRLETLLLDYATNYESLSDAQAAAMLDESLAIAKAEVKTKSAWVPRFRKVLPAMAVTRLYQIDNKLDAILRYEAAAQIPLVGSGKE